jgi:hypothetical protein
MKNNVSQIIGKLFSSSIIVHIKSIIGLFQRPKKLTTFDKLQ